MRTILKIKLLVTVTICTTQLMVSTMLYADASILRGLNRRTFRVVIEPIDAEARSSGLTEQGLQKVVAQRLQKRGLGALNVGDAQLMVRVVVLTNRTLNGETGFGGNIELSFWEKSLLKRDKSTEFLGQTWFKAAITVATKKEFVKEVVINLSNLTDQFINDYQRENPSVK